MPKVKISEFDIDPANNTDINSINIAEGCAPSGINNAIRQLMSDLKAFQTGADGDPFNGAVNGTVGATTPASGAFTTLSASSTVSGSGFSTYLASPPAIGSGTASTGAFTSLSASGAFSANGGATLGDASGDALTINSSAVSIPNGLNFDSNTLVIDATNNRVGVGTASPAYALEVTDFAYVTGAGGRAWNARNTTTSTIVGYGVDNTGGYMFTSQAVPLFFSTNGTERMRILSGGNVGIGTIAPSQVLEVSGNILSSGTTPNRSIIITNNAGTFEIAHRTDITATRITTTATPVSIVAGGANYFSVETNASERMRITSAGNVGIGTSSPQNQSGFGALTLNGSTGGALFLTTGNTRTGQFYNTSTEVAVGSVTAIPLNFYTNNTNRMSLDSSGNLGLGVTPSAWASSWKALQIGGQSLARSVSGAGDWTMAFNAYFDTTDSRWEYLYTGDSSVRYSQTGAGIHAWYTSGSGGGTANNPITFTQAMTLDASGNLGIGTTSPTQKISLVGDSTFNGNASGVRMTMADSLGRTLTLVAPGSVADAYVGTTTNHNLTLGTGSTIRATIDTSGNLLVNTTASIINEKFAVSDTGGNSALTTKQSGGSSGWCGKFWNNATSGNNSFVEFLTETSFTARGSITYNRAGGAVAYNTTSDSRLKDNIESAPSALSKINSVQIRSYDWKETGNHVDFGVIAQELIQVAPEAVTEGIDNEDGTIKSPWAVDTAALVPAMIKAIQELKAEVDSLKAQLNK